MQNYTELPSYRNLLCKSIDWFLYEGNTGTEMVKRITFFAIQTSKMTYWITVKNSGTVVLSFT